MKMKQKTVVLYAGALAFVLQISSLSLRAQVSDDIQDAFGQWAAQDLIPIAMNDLGHPLVDPNQLSEMIGNARIVGLSEAVHASKDPLEFRNRLFGYLVEEHGFEAIAIESGIIESRVLNDYVTEGVGTLQGAAAQGFSWGFDSFQQNQELVRWIKEYNSSVKEGARKIQIFGFDVSGSPANLAVERGPETALVYALDYLRQVDPQAADDIQQRVRPFIAALESTNDYGVLTGVERDSLSAAIADMVSLVQRNRIEYIAESSELDYAWGEQAAIAARHVDAWFRRMPDDWRVSDGFEWTPDAMRVRDRAMAENLEWILGRLEPRGRILVFGAVGHMAATPLHVAGADSPPIVPFGLHVKSRHEDDFVSILNLVSEGEIAICSGDTHTVMKLVPPPENSVEALFSLVDARHYLLDLRGAPLPLSQWLQQEQDHWNGFGSWRFPTSRAFDIAYYVSPITSDCVVN